MFKQRLGLVPNKQGKLTCTSFAICARLCCVECACGVQSFSLDTHNVCLCTLIALLRSKVVCTFVSCADLYFC